MVYTTEKTTANGLHIDWNARQLSDDLDWLQAILQLRLEAYLQGQPTDRSIYDIEPPPLDAQRSLYAQLVQHYEMSTAERMALLLALAPYIRPQLLDIFLQVNAGLQRGFTEFGGLKGEQHGGFLPTGETVLFVLAGNDLATRLEAQQLFTADHYFSSHRIARLLAPPAGEPRFCGQWLLADHLLDLITYGEIRKPQFSPQFPARLLQTAMDWENVVLNEQTIDQLEQLEAWMQYESELMKDWGMKRILKPGFRCLFHGPPGTGKTLTASLIGRRHDRPVYRVDLSALVSKYIGETEKNLERIFDLTELFQCILFFDEADAVFGKRTQVNEAHDRYANQEISYLLQRIEDYDGVVILASNFISNVDDAFLRRFQSVVHFPMPTAPERLQIWRRAFSEKSVLEEGLDLNRISEQYQLAGGSIINVVRFASLQALRRHSKVILEVDLIKGIRREFQKEGKLI